MILITGAGGTIGSALVNELKGTNHPIRLAFHTPEKAARAKAAGYDAVTCDYHQPATLPPALADVDTVFLLGTGILGQVEGEINVVSAAKAAGVKKIVKLSVWGAEKEAFTMAAMYRTVERAIEESGMEWTFLRPNNFMQSFITFDATTIRAEGAIYAPADTAQVNHIDARHCAGGRRCADQTRTCGQSLRAFRAAPACIHRGGGDPLRGIGQIGAVCGRAG
jgi:uncharacterized protein YbjT (DUF2867 family)